MLAEGEGLAAKALESLDISLEAAREEVEKTIGPAGNAPTGSPPFTPRAKKVLELSLRESIQLGHNYIGTEHILLGLVREGEGVAAQVLISLGADLSSVRQQVIQHLSGYQSREEIVGVMRGLQPGSRYPSPPVMVGEKWSAEVVRAGRGPEVFAEAYQRLAELAAGLGTDLDDALIRVTSVDTNEGPGLRLVLGQALESAHPEGGASEETEEPDTLP